MNFLSLCVVASLVACIIFTVVILILSVMGVTVPDTLIQYFFMTFGIEMGATAAIEIAKYALKKAEVKDKIALAKKEGIPLDKIDYFGVNASPTDEEDNYG